MQSAALDGFHRSQGAGHWWLTLTVLANWRGHCGHGSQCTQGCLRACSGHMSGLCHPNLVYELAQGRPHPALCWDGNYDLGTWLFPVSRAGHCSWAAGWQGSVEKSYPPPRAALINHGGRRASEEHSEGLKEANLFPWVPATSSSLDDGKAFLLMPSISTQTLNKENGSSCLPSSHTQLGQAPQGCEGPTT